MRKEQAFQPIRHYRKLCKSYFKNSQTLTGQCLQKICGNFSLKKNKKNHSTTCIKERNAMNLLPHLSMAFWRITGANFSM